MLGRCPDSRPRLGPSLLATVRLNFYPTLPAVVLALAAATTSRHGYQRTRLAAACRPARSVASSQPRPPDYPGAALA